MNKNTTTDVIEINGRTYDATTGLPVGGAGRTPKATKTPVKSAARAKKAAKRQAAPAAHHHPTQHSKTLMRHAVKKPGAGKHHAHGPVSHAAMSAVVSPKAGARQIDLKRLARATSTSKSQHISRFGVADALVQAGGTRPFIPDPIVSDASVTPKPKRQSDLLFEHAMLQATGHRQPRHHIAKKQRVSRRARNWATATLAVVLLGGFMAYQNLASIQLHMAAAKIGFSATLPGYRPAGFSLGHVSYSPGEVALNYHSNSHDERSFALKEQPTAWDSQTLYSQQLVGQSNYHAVQVGDKTVYIDNQNNATWISNGIWYQLTNHQALAGSLLTDLITST